MPAPFEDDSYSHQDALSRLAERLLPKTPFASFVGVITASTIHEQTPRPATPTHETCAVFIDTYTDYVCRQEAWNMTGPVIGAIAGAVTKAILDRLLTKRVPKLDAKGVAPRVEAALADHLRDIANWSGKVQTLDATSPDNLATCTIEIGFDTQPRRFKGTQEVSTVRQEQDLLGGDEHYVLLGNPGSGKTTAIKRLIQTLLFEASEGADDSSQYPLLIRLRELEQGQSLHCALASVLGLEYESVELKGHLGSHSVTRNEIRVMGDPIERVISRVISGTGAVILLDGLDEVWSEAKSDVASEISRLARSVSGAKVIVTSRTGEYGASFEGITVLQLCPLTSDQIHEIALKWLKNPTEFVASLEKLPYRDIADRPLLLTQLLLLYRRSGFLPAQPSRVYKRVVNILLEDWDAQRRVVRQSRYSGFDIERKSEFLAAIAFQLTYALVTSRFNEEQLVTAYLRVHEVFNLPSSDAHKVAREIEAHTGIIIESGHGIYEFSHLSIQEYLCASYMVRGSSPLAVRRALSGHQAPLAIAVTLSSQPADFLARLVLNPEHHAWMNVKSAVPFLSRLMIERPYFEVYEPLGWAVMHLFHRLCKSDVQLPKEAAKFGRMKPVRRSIGRALRWYSIVGGLSDVSSPMIWLQAHDGLSDSYDVPRPRDAAIPRALLGEIAKESPELQVYLSPTPHGRLVDLASVLKQ